ncbi:MAG: NfeD family protein [Spirochaetaceae bacterium]|jgi:membrane protein implicated in regulation of membrane protease activity|nr:NfeD family protein [Spirochaetaceae bacterium]
MDIYKFLFSPWFWLALTVAFTLIELACSFNLVTIWFAFASLAMIFISGLTELLDAPIRFRLHMGLFLFLSIVLLIFTRPIAIKTFRVGKNKTNIDDLIGRDALITKKITKYEKGEAKIKGQTWTAICENDDEIGENTECTIVRIEGVKLVVKRK